MSTDINTAKRQRVADAVLEFFKKRFGRGTAKVNQGIDPSISWRPSFHLRVGPAILAVEADDVLDPIILRLAMNDILHFSRPVTVYLACSLEVFVNDPKQAKVKELKRNGIGLITVDDDGDVVMQTPAIPLAQHIHEDVLSEKIRDLPPKLKIAFRTAHQTFSVNPGQGLQEAGQIVEAIVDAMGAHAVRDNVLSASKVAGSAANTIDALYEVLKPQRAALGGARSFAKNYRNIASHPAKSAKELMTKINSCRDGFFDAIKIARDLSGAAKALNYQLKLHLA
jgi:hypothetical protein